MFGTLGAVNRLKATPKRARQWCMSETKAFAERMLREQTVKADAGDREAGDRVLVIMRCLELLDTLKID